MEKRSFAVQMRELADKSSQVLASPRHYPVIAPDIIKRLLYRIKQEIRACASRGGYYCSFLLYGRHKDEIGFFESRKEAMLAGNILVSQLDTEEIEAVVTELIGAVTLELTWREEKGSLPDDDYET